MRPGRARRGPRRTARGSGVPASAPRGLGASPRLSRLPGLFLTLEVVVQAKAPPVFLDTD